MTRHTLPKSGSRARRVLDALFAFKTSPVDERLLMARHYLNDQSPAKWRKEVYQTLQNAYLIECHGGGFNGVTYWALTDKGGRLMRAEAAAQAAVTEPDLTPEQASARMARPRLAPVFRPLAMDALAIRATRDGALDYRNIPSLYAGKQCA